MKILLVLLFLPTLATAETFPEIPITKAPTMYIFSRELAQDSTYVHALRSGNDRLCMTMMFAKWAEMTERTLSTIAKSPEDAPPASIELRRSIITKTDEYLKEQRHGGQPWTYWMIRASWSKDEELLAEMFAAMAEYLNPESELYKSLFP